MRSIIVCTQPNIIRMTKPRRMRWAQKMYGPKRDEVNEQLKIKLKEEHLQFYSSACIVRKVKQKELTMGWADKTCSLPVISRYSCFAIGRFRVQI
jgi:hypothetical protein